MSEREEFLRTVIPAQQAADNQLLNGDPEPRIRLWSHHDPVTLFGAERSATGWAEVSAVFRWLATHLSQGDLRLDILAADVRGDLAYTVAHEHTTVSFDGAPRRHVRLRVTHTYRREEGAWKIAHRHGDGLPADATAGPGRLPPG
jgi:ketosteroid isomerase-like protein